MLYCREIRTQTLLCSNNFRECQWLTGYNGWWTQILSKEWNLTDLPEGRQNVSNKWIYKIKQHANGDIDLLKACLVVNSFLQN